MRKLIPIMLFCYGLLATSGYSQTNTIVLDTDKYVTGILTDDNNKPIINATIRLECLFKEQWDTVGHYRVLVPKEYFVQEMQCLTDSLGRYKIYIPDTCLNKEVRISASTKEYSSTLIDFFLPKLPYSLNIPLHYNIIHGCGSSETIIIIDGQKIPNSNGNSSCGLNSRPIDCAWNSSVHYEYIPTPGITLHAPLDPDYCPAQYEGPSTPLPAPSLFTLKERF